MLPRWLDRLLTHRTLHGYEHPELVEMVFRKTAAYVPSGGWPLVLGKETVLDFGGGCGVHYRLAALQNPTIRWAVVETPAMVARSSVLATNHLRFFTDIGEAAAWLGSIDLMHCDGALQYTPNPEQALHDLCAIRAARNFWTRMLFSENRYPTIQHTTLGENGPGAPHPDRTAVQYVRTPISMTRFLTQHSVFHKLVGASEDWFLFERIAAGSPRPGFLRRGTDYPI